jgi:hypothetical protein
MRAVVGDVSENSFIAQTARETEELTARFEGLRI